jgi:iron complex outermembrane receptor protein/vitamin B12 transporter
VPVNDIGGAFNYSGFLTTGVESVEALRDANSVVFGSDAMAGVVSVTTRRGQTRTPALEATLDAGNLSTHHEELSLGGAAGRVDYFGAYSHFANDNDVANNAWTNDSFAGRVGVAIGSRSELSANFRRSDNDYGIPNAIDFYGLADDSRQEGDSTYFGLAARSQLTLSRSGIVRALVVRGRLHVREPVPDRRALRSLRFRRQLPRRDRDDRGSQRHAGHRPGDPRLRRELSSAFRIAGQAASW